MVLAAITIVAYGPTLRCGYVWDDDAYVTKNETLRSADGLWRIWTDDRATPQYYPLVFTSYWIEYQVWGLEPTGYHATNVALHTLAVLLAWRVLLTLGLTRGVAWLSALIFAIHPVHVESVAWIAERKNVLSAVFYLGAILAYLKFDGFVCQNDVDAAPQRKGAWYVVALILFCGSLLSKTVTASLPGAVLLAMWWKRGRLTASDFGRLVPFFALGVAFGLHTLWLEAEHVGATGTEWDLSPIERLLVAGRAVWFYAAKLLLPLQLTFVYPRWEIDTGSLWQYVYPLGLLVALALLWVARHRVGRGALAAILFFIVTLVPALGFFDVYPMRFSYVADHFQYLASLGVISLVAALAGTLYGRAQGSFRLIATGTVVSVVAVLILLTWRQTHAYTDAQSLWHDTLAKNPDAWMAAHNLGVLYLSQHRNDDAKRYFQKVLELRPDDVRAHNNMGSLRLLEGDLSGAVAHFEAAIRHEPDFVGARLNLSQALLAEGESRTAIEHYLSALDVDSNVADAHEQLGLVLMRAANGETAEWFLGQALRIKPKWPSLVNELAWILATSPMASRRDPDRSLALANRAVEMSHAQDANILDTLAAAYAQNGEFDRAVEVAQQALARARESGDAVLANEIANRIAVYQQGRAYVSASEPIN